MADLIAFLRARLDGDERTARAAHRPGRTGDGGRGIADGTDGGRTGEAPNAAVAAHIARHDPARVLAEVHAKRQLLEASAAACAPACGIDGEHAFGRSCALGWMGPVEEADGGRWIHDDTGARFAAPPVTTEWTLRVLALPYSGHPDYRDEWRP
ncbi:DUF6221 family protein [Streptomyces sp. NPDC057540]|uniref:DUF6221 family protein n=1 Tax=Streptomyces sp. NPDC057540 TaxID=3346160 RepID=UPI0036885050